MSQKPLANQKIPDFLSNDKCNQMSPYIHVLWVNETLFNHLINNELLSDICNIKLKQLLHSVLVYEG